MSIKKGIFYVFIANVINLVINLVTAFVLPKYLSIDTYANIKLFNLYVTYLGILHLGFADGMYLRYGGKKAESLNSKETIKEFKTFKLFQLVINVIMVVISLIARNTILLLCSLIILPVNVSNYIRNLYNAIGEFKKYSRYTNINTLMLLIINLILLFIIKTNNYYVYIIAYVIAYFVYWFFIEYEVRKMFGKSDSLIEFNKNYLIEDIKSGFFLMMGNFCNAIFTSIDRLMVKNLIGLAEFAYYSFAVSIENLMNVFITPVSTTMYNYFCQKKSKKQILKIKKYVLIFASTLIMVIFPAKFIIEHWITKYARSISILFLLIAAQCVAVMIKIVHVNLYKAQKKQNRYFKIMICVIILSLALNFIGYFIYKDIISIAIATLITNVIWFIIGEIDLREYHLKIMDYIFLAINVLSFVICGMRLNSILGCGIYLMFLIITTLLFEREVISTLFTEAHLLIKKFVDRRTLN